MSVQTRAYDNEHGDPVVVLVATGTFDVSRLINLHAGNATPRCEDGGYADRMLRQVKRHNGGRAALKLLKDHGGPDFSDPDDMERLKAEVRAETLREAEEGVRQIWDETSDSLLGEGISRAHSLLLEMSIAADVKASQS